MHESIIATITDSISNPPCTSVQAAGEPVIDHLSHPLLFSLLDSAFPDEVAPMQRLGLVAGAGRASPFVSQMQVGVIILCLNEKYLRISTFPTASYLSLASLKRPRARPGNH